MSPVNPGDLDKWLGTLAESAETDSIRRAVQDHVSAVNAGDLDQWTETLTDDVVFLPPDQPRIEGKDAVRLWAKENFFDPFQMLLDLSFDELDVVGPMAFVHGRFALPLTPRATGGSTQLAGKFIYLFRQQPDGAWKFARVIWNYDEHVGGN